MKDRIEGAPEERILLEIPAKLCLSPKYTKGSLHMTFGDVGSEIYVPKETELPDVDAEPGEEQKEHIMTVIGCLGGGLEIQDRLTGEHWFISFLDIANAYRPTQLERVEESEDEDTEEAQTSNQ